MQTVSFYDMFGDPYDIKIPVRYEIWEKNGDRVMPIGVKGRRCKLLVRLGDYKPTTFRWWVVDLIGEAIKKSLTIYQRKIKEG